jgi:type I restriction enzyme M protein
MFASLNPNGKMAIVLDTGAVSRGSGNQGSNKERDIRKKFVDEDLVEAVLLLPENLFYNTTAAGIILVLNRNKRHTGELLIINASKLLTKGRPKNILDEKNSDQIVATYVNWKPEIGLSTIIKKGDVIKNDCLRRC